MQVLGLYFQYTFSTPVSEFVTYVQRKTKDVTLCVIWCNLYNLKNVKNVHGGVLLLEKLLKVLLLHGYFSRFLNCKTSTKLRKASHIFQKSFLSSFKLSFYL